MKKANYFFLIFFIAIVMGCSNSGSLEVVKDSSTSDSLEVVKDSSTVYVETAKENIAEMKSLVSDAIYILENVNKPTDKWKSSLELWQLKTEKAIAKAKSISVPEEYKETHKKFIMVELSLEKLTTELPKLLTDPVILLTGMMIQILQEDIDTYMNQLEIQELKN